MKKLLFIAFSAAFLGSTGCKSYEILRPEETQEVGLYPKDYPDKIVVSFNQDIVCEKTKIEPGEKTGEGEQKLAETDKQGVVHITEKEIVIEKNTPGVVEEVDGDKMLLNFGQPVGAKEDDPEIIVPVKRVILDPEISGDDIYMLDLTPLPGEDTENPSSLMVSNTSYKVKEGRTAKVTYKKVRDRISKKAKGKKPGGGGED